MALAYHILAHKNPTQVHRLLRALEHPEDVFVIHFDRRSSRAMHALAHEWGANRPNVIIQIPRVVLWGGPQIVDRQIEAMQLALAHDSRWTHFINLSGQDFPLKPRSEVVACLDAQPATNYVDWFDPFETKQWSDLEDRLGRMHLHSPLLHRALSVPGLGRRVRRIFGWQNRIPFVPGYRRATPDFFKYYGGSNHAVIARAGCEYLVSAPAAQRIRRWLARTAVPDESTFQSILLNSPLASTIVRRTWRFIEFTSDTPHPFTFESSHFSRLAASREWFARKFDETVDAAILDRLELHLRHFSHEGGTSELHG